MESNTEIRQPSSLASDVASPSSGKTYNQDFLINKLNYTHFVDGTISATFRHRRYGTSLSLPVKPLPCADQHLACLWSDREQLPQNLLAHDFLHLLISDGQKSLLVKPELTEIDEQGIKFLLPQKCSELNARKIRRHPCTDITVQLFQNGTLFQGTLVNFSAVALHVKLFAEPPKTFQWINPAVSVNVLLSNREETVFSGEFRIHGQSCGQKERSFTLILVHHHIRKFQAKKYRSTRQCLVPSPNLLFVHPLAGYQADLKIADISGSGFSVEEDSFNSLLLPGLIIPEAELVFANGGRLSCKIQVIYRQEGSLSGKENRTRCGIAILDMKIEDQVKILAILSQGQNERCYVNNQINLDALWKFFFETGFIYPEKYASVQQKKELLKDTFQKIYSNKSNIARHFLYQDNGVILAHMAMIRLYTKSWMIHHHAAQKRETRKGGISVLGQIIRYINELYRLYSAHLDFIFGYYRPENSFPQKVFGGAADYIADSKVCSVDSFAYFHSCNVFSDNLNISSTLHLNRTSQEDLLDLRRFLEYTSGGLMVPALDLELVQNEDSELIKEFEDLGLKRKRHLFSLKVEKDLKAIFIVNVSDIGLNISDLTSCIKIIILDQTGLSGDCVNLIISMLCTKFQLGKTPVLIYPYESATSMNLPVEKRYNLWILNLQYSDRYLDYCNKILPNF